MRSLALAQEWKSSGYGVSFLLSEGGQAYAGHLTANQIPFSYCSHPAGSGKDAEETARTARLAGAEAVILDGYRFGAEFLQQVADTGAVTIVIDDYGHASRYPVDFVLNQNLFADAGMYPSRSDHTRLLLGPEYYLFRQEFRTWIHTTRNRAGPVRNILLSLGASDPDNLTLQVLETILPVIPEDCSVTALIGAGNLHTESIRAFAAGTPRKIDIQVDARNIPALMAQSDFAISAAGTTACELAFMGTPMALIATSENQVPVCRSLTSRQAAVALGHKDHLDRTRIRETVQSFISDAKARVHLSENGRKILDGAGASRVLWQITASWVTLEPVHEADCRQIWSWAGDPVVRASAFSTADIPWEEHCRWFAGKTADPACTMYIAISRGGDRVGQIRFDTDPSGFAAIDVSVAAAFRGKGIGTAIIRRGVRQHMQDKRGRGYYSLVKAENRSSLRAFERAGFRPSATPAKPGSVRLEYSSG